MPVIDDMVYVPGAEGFRLTEMMSVAPCSDHRFNFAHSVHVLLQRTSGSAKVRCPCDQRTDGKAGDIVRRVDHVRHDRVSARAAAYRARSGGRSLWAFEMSQVVTAYRWILNHRSTDYTKCCDAVVVYQIQRSKWLPPGLYVYRRRPTHFGCTVDRPVAVIEQFNLNRTAVDPELPNAITIDMFPGCDNYSAMYIVTRKQSRLTPEYGNRIFGEAAALGIVESVHPPGYMSASERYEVAIRTERMYVLDLRWKAFDTRTRCVHAIPRIKGMKAILWSNHNGDVQNTECKVLSWLFGHSNELPSDVQMVDYTAETLGVRYILVDMDTFTGVLPQPPRAGMSFFTHTHFTGDLATATAAIGHVTGPRSRMGSPCQGKPLDVWYTLPSMGSCHPTPYTCGDRYADVNITDEMKADLIEWTLKTDAADCQGLAVQHTLYYHWETAQYKMMLCHTVPDADTSLNMFRL